MTPSSTLHAITVLGHDRPGIIAETTGRLADLGLNLEDSTMTLLRGHFAMMLVCAGAPEADQIEAALAPLTTDGTLTVTVREVPVEQPEASDGSPWVLTVHGGDRAGIVSSVVTEVARVGGNITDLTTRLAGDLYLLVAEIDLPASVDVSAVEAAIRSVASDLGVGATLRPAEADEL
ncbi:ACT domain-containing protein [Nocardioides psychrotolerans]|uniref:glycine cleavage system protein R n=1 Tax=Nocardioides psychrotolerans TaxID=1005945 RepID=UPI00313844B8